MARNVLFHFSLSDLTIKLHSVTKDPFVDSLDQDQTSQNMQSDLVSTVTKNIVRKLCKILFSSFPQCLPPFAKQALVFTCLNTGKRRNCSL